MSALETSLSLNSPVEVWTLIDTYLLGCVRSFELLYETETNYLGNLMYPGVEYGCNISTGVYKYSQFKVGNEIFGSQGSQSRRSSYIIAKWCSSTGTQIETSNLRPAHVISYFKHSVSVQGSLKPHVFAFVEWFKPCATRNLLGNAAQVWCHDLFEPLGPPSYLPLLRIESKFVAAVDKLQEETVLAVMPLQYRIYL